MARKVNVFKDQAKLRTGGSRFGPDNVIGKIDHGDYEALYQCTGEEVSESGATNRWWVKIRANGKEGWVSGTVVDEHGGDNALIRDTDKVDLPQEPTRFV